MCASRKCSIPSCNRVLQSCQLINGMCPQCFEASKKINSNVSNQSQNNQQPIKPGR